jgi:hypothetical protein
MIFWQTARTARRARPGQRVPTARAAGGQQLAITIDSRERYPYRFAAPTSRSSQRRRLRRRAARSALRRRLACDAWAARAAGGAGPPGR